MSTQKSRALGCFYGQLIGDALGARYEFTKEDLVQKMITDDKTETGHLPIKGGGPFYLGAGRITDDSEMALGLARSLIQGKSDAHEKYRDWMDSRPSDIGFTTKIALSNKSPCPDSLSNGCLMRCSPLGIYAVGKNADEELFKTITKDVMATHSNYIAIETVKIYVMTLKTLIETGDKTQALTTAKELITHPLIEKWFTTATEKGLRFPVEPSDPDAWGSIDCAWGQAQGYIGMAFQLAFYELAHGESFESSLVDIVGLGGDTDTNGCIAAALLGAYYGVENIPEDWKEQVKNPKMTFQNRPTKRLEKYPDAFSGDLEELALKLLAM